MIVLGGDSLERQRERRVAAIWKRFVAAWRKAYGDAGDLDRFETTTQRSSVMGRRLRQGRPPGFRLRNRLEIADLSVDEIEIKLKQPTRAEVLPGTAEKRELLAARIARGEELWHEDDAQRADD